MRVGQNVEQIESVAFEPQTQAYNSLLSMAWRRKSLVALGIVVGLVLGALYYAQRPPVYRFDAQILVIKKRPDVLPALGSDTTSFYEDYLATHQVLIKSPIVVGRAVKKPGVTGLKSLAGLTDPTGLLIGSLTVNRDTTGMTSNNILNLSFRGKIADECAVLLGAVIDSY